MLTKSTLAWGGALLLTGAPLAAQAGQLTLDISIPQQNTAEYKKPFVVAWFEDASGNNAGNLLLWCEARKPDCGAKYLKDLRNWWRKGGRDTAVPIAGITGATRAPGRQTLTLDTATALKDLKAGQYSLVVEAARESGGHDLVKLPFTYNPTRAASAKGQGDGELGAVAVAYKP
jgi:hypothetical protein